MFIPIRAMLIPMPKNVRFLGPIPQFLRSPPFLTRSVLAVTRSAAVYQESMFDGGGEVWNKWGDQGAERTWDDIMGDYYYSSWNSRAKEENYPS